MNKKRKRKITYTPKTLFIIIITTFIGIIATFVNDMAQDSFLSDTKKMKTKKVEKVHDGDTINIITNNNKMLKIRLFGIDAPELKQKYGEESRICLENMIKNKKIEYAIKEKSDKYGRIVGIIFADDKNINLEMVKKGCAWSYWSYNKSLYFLFEQYKAKYKKVGLWQDDNPQPPWEYRHRK